MSSSTIGTLSLCPLALALAACASPQGTVMGSVFEDQTFRPVPDARMQFNAVDGPGGPVSSGLNFAGQFVIDVPAGRYTVSALHPTLQVCASQRQPIVVQVGTISRPQICLASKPEAIAAVPQPVLQPVSQPSSEPVAEPVTIPVAVPQAVTLARPQVVPAPLPAADPVALPEAVLPISLPPVRASSPAADPVPSAAPAQSLADAGQASAAPPAVAPLPVSRQISDIPSQYPPAPAPAFPPAPALRIAPRQR